MRRLGLLVLFLFALSLTTAFAASMDVEADNLSSTRTSVSISVPQLTSTYYLINQSELNPVINDSQESQNMKPGDVRQFELYFESGHALVGKDVELVVYTNSGSGEITARLQECPSPLPNETGCDDLTSTTLSWTSPGVQTLSFPAPVQDVATGHWLRLRISNESDAGWNLFWGKDDGVRDSRLVISDASTP